MLGLKYATTNNELTLLLLEASISNETFLLLDMELKHYSAVRSSSLLELIESINQERAFCFSGLKVKH